jgi:hypothetical protein
MPYYTLLEFTLLLKEAKIVLMLNVLCLNVASSVSTKLLLCYLLCRHESIVIQEILGRIFNELNRKFSSASKDLVGIASRVEEMLGLCLSEGLGGVRFVGICGMGGLVKQLLHKKFMKEFLVILKLAASLIMLEKKLKKRSSFFTETTSL